jgi:hypothetical protein
MHKVAIIILASCILIAGACTYNSKPQSAHGKIAGRITSKTTGEPIGNAFVKILHTGLQTETEYDGDYSIRYVPLGIYDIMAIRKGFRGDTIRNIRVIADCVSIANFELPEGSSKIHGYLPSYADTNRGQVTGCVTDKLTQEPIELARIHIDKDINKRVLSDSTGAYELSSIRPGNYRIVARTENIGYWFVISQQINIKKGQQSVVDFELVPDPILVSSYVVKYETVADCSIDGKIQGSVRDKTNGEFLPFCRIRLLDIGTKTTTDLSGQFSFDSIPPGKYSLDAKIMGYNVAIAQSVLVEAGKIATIDFKLALEWIHID